MIGPNAGSPPISDDIVITANETIQDVVVTVNLNHTWLGDIEMTISNTQGGSVALMTSPSGQPGALDSSDLGSGGGPAAYVFTDTGSATQTILDLMNMAQ